MGFSQSANWQHANHAISIERGGDYRAMASSQYVLSEGEKREKEGGFWLVDGVEVSVMGPRIFMQNPRKYSLPSSKCTFL